MKALLSIVVIIVLLLLMLSCTDNKDCPICPDTGSIDSLPACDVYLSDRYAKRFIYHYNTSNPGVLDSIYLEENDHDFGKLVLAKDGVHLLSSNGRCNVYDLKTRNKVKVLSETGVLYPSPKGNYMAISNGHIIYIYDGTTFDRIRRIAPDVLDSLYMHFICWSADETKICGITYQEKIIIYDIISDSLCKIIDYEDPYGNNCDNFDIHKIQVTNDNNKLYLIVQYKYQVGRFYVYDIENDSTVEVYAAGKVSFDEIDITPDGNQVILTDPGAPKISEFGSEDIIYFDTQMGIIESRIAWPNFTPGRFTISSDSRYSFVVAAETCGTGFAAIDNITHRTVDVFTTHPSTIIFGYVTCQRY